MDKSLARVVVSLGLILFLSRIAGAQSADNVLLVVNQQSPSSVEIGDYYARRRSIPQDHIVHLQAPTSDSIARADFELQIEAPLGNWLTAHDLQDRILYIVLTKGIPLRVAGTEGRNGTVASVDSELTLLYRKMVGTSFPLIDRVPNPYFAGDIKITANTKRFTRFQSDIYLVTRLDGYRVDDVEKLIDRSTATVKDGKVVLDQRGMMGDPGGDRWLSEAADRLREAGFGDRVVIESTTKPAQTNEPVLGYYSWGSNDRAQPRRQTGLHFAAGAIGGTFVSTDGRTFSEPPIQWLPSNPDGGPVFAGSFQSLAGDLIREGITGVSGHVAEPYLDATIRPQILFPAYLSGFNLAESYYLAMPFLSWQTVIVGDPLCAPFEKPVLSAEAIAKSNDAETGLPGLFSERRLAALSRGGINPAALKLLLRAQVESSHDRKDGLEDLLTRAIALEPRLTAAGFMLTAVYEDRGDYDKANALYRSIIGLEPQNVLALNNLAFSLAVRKNQPADALPFAERAYRLASSSSPVIDTLGWIEHLLGDDKAAAPLLEKALAGLPGSAEANVHAATVHANLGDFVNARKEMEAALKIDAKLADLPDIKALVRKIKST